VLKNPKRWSVRARDKGSFFHGCRQQEGFCADEGTDCRKRGEALRWNGENGLVGLTFAAGRGTHPLLVLQRDEGTGWSRAARGILRMLLQRDGGNAGRDAVGLETFSWLWRGEGVLREVKSKREREDLLSRSRTPEEGPNTSRFSGARGKGGHGVKPSSLSRPLVTVERVSKSLLGFWWRECGEGSPTVSLYTLHSTLYTLYNHC
jgi:hypothetical protein